MTARSSRFWVKVTKAEHDGPDRAFLLCRQSITKAESISLDDQERQNRAYAERQGYNVVRVHHSPNVKGWQEEREDHDLLRALAAQGEIDVVVSYDVSRTARTVRILETLAHDLERRGVRLEFAQQEMANSPMGRQMLGMFAELETAHRSVRLRDTWQTLRRMGRWHGVSPYGYRRANRTIVPDEREADTARRILAMALAGQGTVAIRNALHADGTPTRHGGPWHESHLARMVRNPVYAGGMVIDGEIVWPDGDEAMAGLAGRDPRSADSHAGVRSTPSPNAPILPRWHEPLISRNDWERLQRILPSTPHLRTKPVSSWLEGIVRHACGCRMYLVGAVTPRGDMLGMFRCANRYKAQRCVLRHSEVSARNLERAVRTALAADLARRVDPEAMIRHLVATSRHDGSQDARRLIAKRRERLLTRRANVLEVRLEGTKDRAWWRAEDAKIAAELATLAAEDAALPDAADPERVRSESVALGDLAEAVRDADGDALALLLRPRGITAVVGEGGIRLAYPPELARHVPEPVTVKIPRARTK